MEKIYLILDALLLLLIGMGPKIAVVPFLDLTRGMDDKLSRQVAARMVRTAVVTALLLLLLGAPLMKLLHFTPGAASIAGGIILLFISMHMIISPAKNEKRKGSREDRDPMKTAVYPLAVPYLLNPAGIAVIVIISGIVESVIEMLIMLGLILLIGLLDLFVFKNINRFSKFIDPVRLIVTEVVFGVLLAALSVQLVLEGVNYTP